MATEQIVNQVFSFLNEPAGVDIADVAITLVDASAFPVPGLSYRISVDTEIMIVTAVVGNILAVIRGQEGTTAAVHTNGTVVNTVVTAGAMYAVFQAL